MLENNEKPCVAIRNSENKKSLSEFYQELADRDLTAVQCRFDTWTKCSSPFFKKFSVINSFPGTLVRTNIFKFKEIWNAIVIIIFIISIWSSITISVINVSVIIVSVTVVAVVGIRLLAIWLVEIF